MAATKASAERQGPLLALSLGSSARTVADEVPDDVLRNGTVYDLGDGRGAVHRNGPEILFAVLRNKFPPDTEALMLRAGLEFFSFTPTREEDLSSLFLSC